jgi:U4/U6.U5 tri-snRNP component SNU23
MAGVRRTWDKSYYESKAKERIANGDEIVVQPGAVSTKTSLKEEFKAASKDAAGPMGSDRAFLHARTERIDIDSKVGKVEVIDQGQLDKSGGYWCEVCACLLKDSASYLDHINGKKRKLLTSNYDGE